MKKRITFFVCLTLVLCLLAVEASAVVLDTTRKGSIMITTSYQGTAVSGGTLALYRVAKVHSYNGQHSFVFLPEFAASGASLDDLSTAQTAKLLADHAAANSISGIEKIIENAQVVFEDLEQGVYLLVQHDAAAGYKKMNPFLVTVPMLQNGQYIYDVDGSPKLQLEPGGGGGGGGGGEPDDPEDPPKEDPKDPPKEDGEKLPDTGLDYWPIPLLAVGGMFLVALGWYLKATSRKKRKRCR